MVIIIIKNTEKLTEVKFFPLSPRVDYLFIYLFVVYNLNFNYHYFFSQKDPRILQI